MKSKFLFFTLFTACLALATSCGSTKGYSGANLFDNEVASIQPEYWPDSG